MKPVHLIGVPLDLGGNRRGVDMGPSAFRIAGLAEQLAALGLHGRGQRRSADADSGNDPGRRMTRTRSTSATSRKVCAKLYQTALASLAAGAIPLVLGGDHSLGAGSVGAACEMGEADERPADRPAVDRRARRHEHAGDNVERQRARHAAGGAARPGARRACANRRRSRPRCFPSTPC